MNEKGEGAPLSPRDFIVVAPYNDQVDLLRDTLDGDDRTRGVPVGTVDKFQGREAAVVFFSMTTSSSNHVPAVQSSCSHATASTWRSAVPDAWPIWSARKSS